MSYYENKILIGSKAAKIHFNDFPREPKDIDYISKTKISNTDTHYSPAFDYLFDKHTEIPSPDELYTIKYSHCFWDIHWHKTMNDILFFQSKGCKLIPEFYNLLHKDWENIHGKKKVNLNMSNETFFNDYVKRIYEHDKIHYAISYPDPPMYEKIKFDKSKAFTERRLFENLSYEDKVKTVNEELSALLIERYLLPEFKYSYSLAYLNTLKDVITRLTKGWFPEFIVNNFSEFKILKNDFMINSFKYNIDKIK